MQKNKKFLFMSIGVTASVVVLIIWFSGQPVTESDGLSRGLARRLLEFFSKEASAAELSHLNHVLRKLAHFTLYFVLGCGLTGITLHGHRKTVIAVCLSILLGFLFASTDEFHQLFSEGRGPSVQDVLLDTCGIATGSVLTALCRYIHVRKRTEKINIER